MWDFKLLKTFVAIVDCGGFTAAADRLFLTQSTVSHQIKRLEDQIGARLFRRNRAFCDLTPEGDRLYKDVASLVRQADDLWQSYRSDELRGVIRVGAADDGFNDVLAAALKRFSAEHPKVHVDFEIGLTRQIQARFEAGDFDLVLIRCRADEPSGPALLLEPLSWCVPDGFRQADYDAVPIAVGPVPCLYRETISHALENAGIAYEVVVTCPSHIGIRTAVQSGMAISALPASMLGGEADVISGDLPPLPQSKLAISLRKEVSGRTPAQALYDALLTLQRDTV
ncbi:LysR family transcriptional regulator [Coralliovum pocilloporae]|uniref:LysR family transcriptional regulator n=1 Tax=Coralliovum pocilloporae TaxID=3066369 RepID=UPI0033070BBC